MAGGIKAEAHTQFNHSCLFSSEITNTRASTNPPSNMKAIFVLAALVAVAVARPQDPKDAQILRYESDNIGVDGYKFAFETSDGVKREETGELKNVGTETEAIVVRGSFSWKDAEGKEYTINFVADENGYRPEGAHLNH